MFQNSVLIVNPGLTSYTTTCTSSSSFLDQSTRRSSLTILSFPSCKLPFILLYPSLCQTVLSHSYKQPAGPQRGSTLNSNHPKAYLTSLHHNAALCDHCMERISGEWFRCVYCAKDLCDVCENLNAHDKTHFFYVFKAPVDMQIFRIVAELDNPRGSPPVVKFPVYLS